MLSIQSTRSSEYSETGELDDFQVISIDSYFHHFLLNTFSRYSEFTCILVQDIDTSRIYLNLLKSNAVGLTFSELPVRIK